MYLAHSNIETDALPVKKQPKASTAIERMIHKQRVKAIANTLKKYEAEIKIIQQHKPGWLPTFKFNEPASQNKKAPLTRG